MILKRLNTKRSNYNDTITTNNNKNGNSNEGDVQHGTQCPIHK